jgi:hypothetical protein
MRSITTYINSQLKFLSLLLLFLLPLEVYSSDMSSFLPIERIGKRRKISFKNAFDNTGEGYINFGRYSSVVKGSKGMPVKANLKKASTYDHLIWEIIETGGKGIYFSENGTATYQSEISNTTLHININEQATSTEFTVRVRGNISNSNKDTLWVSSNPIKVIDAPSLQKTHLKIISHDSRIRLPMVSGSTYEGSWKVDNVTRKNNPNAPWTIPPEGVYIANSSDTMNAIISESVIAHPSTSAGTLTAHLTWQENLSTAVYNSGYKAPSLEVTFVGCQNNIDYGTGEPVQMMYDYDGDGIAEYSWCARELEDENGNIWLDRNMGAYRLAQSSDDAASYGDLYQWGRPMDGHQKRIQRNDDPAEGKGIQGEMLNGLWENADNNSNTPNDPRFIEGDDLPSTQNYDWVDNNNSERWSIDPQGPCPRGYHVPTQEELIELRSLIISKGRNSNAAFNVLRMPASGKRLHSDGALESVGSRGFYHSSTHTGGSKAYGIYFHSSGCSPNANFHAIGFSVRCRKD